MGGAVDGQVLTYAQVHELMHRDISIGNEYRKERIKLLTTLATGVFALTVTFHKDLFHSTLTPEGLSLLLLGWAALIVSLLAEMSIFPEMGRLLPRASSARERAMALPHCHRGG